MICDQCNMNDANIQMRLTRNGETIDLNLCPGCAAKLQIEGGMMPSLFDSFFSPGWPSHDLITPALFGSDIGREPGQLQRQIKACPVCGQRYEDFRKTGLLGCSTCYETFRPWIEQVLKRVQRDTRHTGHRPSLIADFRKSSQEASQSESPAAGAGDAGVKAAEPKDKLTALKLELSQAVQAEDYNRAAKLRDQIQGLEEA
jgi:protein arginine kinase activator